MGVINQGILGGFSGKVGPVVGGKWKDIDYMRGYVVPANPNTAGQQAVRSKFAALVALARQILGTILQPYWDLFYSDMSGFNAWISQNYALASSAGVIDQTAIMSKGTLTGLASPAATYDTGTGIIEGSWSSSLSGNAEATDSVLMVGLDESGQRLFVNTSTVARNSSTDDLTIETGLTAANVNCYFITFRGTGSELIVSDSQPVVCSAV